MALHELSFRVHGCTVQITTDSDDVVEGLERDYGTFVLDGVHDAPQLRVSALVKARTLNAEAAALAPFLTKANVECRLSSGVLYLQGDEVAWSSVRPYLTTSISSRLFTDRELARFHASAIGVEKSAVILTGESRSGKTSLALVYALTGAEFLANEFVFMKQRSNRAQVFGLPQATTLGTGAHGWFSKHYPGMFPAADSGPEVNSKALLETQIGQKITVPLAQIPGVRVSSGDYPLRCVVFPEANFNLNSPRFQEVPRDMAAALLLRAGDPPFKWKAWPVNCFEKYVECLSSTCEFIAGNVKCIHFEWCEDHNLNQQVLSDFVESIPAPESPLLSTDADIGQPPESIRS